MYVICNYILIFYIALILGGDIGNLIDRTFFFDRGVVDFISVQSWLPGFGIFNIADSCLVVGILLLLVYFIYDEFKSSKEEKEHKEVVKKLENEEVNSSSSVQETSQNNQENDSNEDE